MKKKTKKKNVKEKEVPEINSKFTRDKEYNLVLMLQEYNKKSRIELSLDWPVLVYP